MNVPHHPLTASLVALHSRSLCHAVEKRCYASYARPMQSRPRPESSGRPNQSFQRRPAPSSPLITQKTVETYGFAKFYDGVAQNIKQNAQNVLGLDPNVRPLNIAYFTDNPNYYSLVIRLNDAIRRNGLDFDAQYDDVDMPAWMNQSEMGGTFGMKLDDTRHAELVSKLSILFVNREMDPSLSEAFFSVFVKAGAGVNVQGKTSQSLDEHGRAFAQGSKKTARAAAFTIHGTGEFMINGQIASDYFDGQISLLDELISPLSLTGTVGKFNVWAQVRGGGPAGQTQALKLALSRCLAIHDPAYSAALEQELEVDKMLNSSDVNQQSGVDKKLLLFQQEQISACPTEGNDAFDPLPHLRALVTMLELEQDSEITNMSIGDWITSKTKDNVARDMVMAQYHPMLHSTFSQLPSPTFSSELVHMTISNTRGVELGDLNINWAAVARNHVSLPRLTGLVDKLNIGKPPPPVATPPAVIAHPPVQCIQNPSGPRQPQDEPSRPRLLNNRFSEANTESRKRQEPEDFCTAREQLVKENQTSYKTANGNAGGDRKRQKFTSPLVREEEKSTSGEYGYYNLKGGPKGPGLGRKPVEKPMENQPTKPDAKPVDERLKNLDPQMVELIQNEMIDAQANMVSWEDIAGLQHAKKTIYEAIIWPMQRPDIFTGLRGPPKGVLLFGPPGTGKTLIAKAIAAQCQTSFFSISSSSLTSKWVGEGEKMMRTLFAVARVHQPAVIFMDEIDSLLCKRTEGENDAARKIKTEFLVQFDGCGTAQDDRILIIGATNRPQELDDAARRRFRKKLYIPLPDSEARLALFRNLLRKERHSLTQEQLVEISALTEGYSGSDCDNLCRDAALGPIRDLQNVDVANMDFSSVEPIGLKHLVQAMAQIKPSVSPGDLEEYVKYEQEFGSNR